MKKLICIFLCIVMIASMTGCGAGSSASSRTSGQSSGVSDVLQAGMEQAELEKSTSDTTPTPYETVTEDKTDGRQRGISENAPVPLETEGADSSSAPAGDVDIDLTVLSSTVVYSEVYGMLMTPEDYIGKSIKMDGLFAVYHDETSGKYYFACIIQDATACCAQGIEFILRDNYIYPDDYPETGSEICVSGIFDIYEEAGHFYCTLRDAELLQV